MKNPRSEDNRKGNERDQPDEQASRYGSPEEASTGSQSLPDEEIQRMRQDGVGDKSKEADRGRDGHLGEQAKL